MVGYTDNYAFLWQDGVLTDLNDLIPPGSDWELLVAYDINDYGQIVGYGRLAGEFQAFLLSLWDIDCNGNGISDECDILFGYSLDCNENSIPDECEGSGDYDFDCDIDLDDYAAFNSCMQGPTAPYPLGSTCIYLDMDRDEDVDMADAAIFFTVFGNPPQFCTGDGGVECFTAPLTVSTSGPRTSVYIDRNPLWTNDPFIINQTDMTLHYTGATTAQLTLNWPNPSSASVSKLSLYSQFWCWRINGVLQPPGQRIVNVTLDPSSGNPNVKAEALFRSGELAVYPLPPTHLKWAVKRSSR